MTDRPYLASWRIHAGLRQKQVAFEMNVSISTVARMEAGTLNATLRLIEAYARAVGTTPALLLGTDPQAAATYHLSRFDDIPLDELADMMKALSQAAQNRPHLLPGIRAVAQRLTALPGIAQTSGSPHRSS